MYHIEEVDATDPREASTIRYFNAMVPDWPPLTDHHLQNGHWWIINATNAAGFTGMVPFTPFCGVGYLKRCYISPEHRGNGLQIRSLFIREAKAKGLGWKQLISETTNIASAGNFIKAGYSPTVPEQRWGAPESLYFAKYL
jgi:hypothetical protein